MVAARVLYMTDRGVFTSPEEMELANFNARLTAVTDLALRRVPSLPPGSQSSWKRGIWQ